MFRSVSRWVTRYWPLVFVGWAAVFLILHFAAPHWDDIARDGDFAYLPERVASVQGDRLKNAAFGKSDAQSDVVIVMARRDGPLTPDDLAFADVIMKTYEPGDDDSSPIVSIIGPTTEVVGEKLKSPVTDHGQAALIILQLKGEIMAVENMKPLTKIYETLDELKKSPQKPVGLELGVTGSGAVGTEMLLAAEESIRNTEVATISLIIVILLVVYRAPLLAAVPLLALAVAVFTAFDVLALLAGISLSTNWFEFAVFKTTKIFVVVVLFGSGTDYCLFLIARYKEELGKGVGIIEAAGRALDGVSAALLASAWTTILGLGMMLFSDFGKFRNGGPAIAVALIVALVACLTLAPAILCVLGKKVFWPFRVDLSSGEESDDIRLGRKGIMGSRFEGLWNFLGEAVLRRPGVILLCALAVMAPFVWQALSVDLTYDLLSELGPDRRCVQGTALLREYFPAGETGPVTILAYHPTANFLEGPDRYRVLPELVKAIYNMETTGPDGQPFKPIQSVRSLVNPLGEKQKAAGLFGSVRRGVITGRAKYIYVAQNEPYRGKVTRLDVVFPYDPFSIEAIHLLDELEKYLNEWAQTSEHWQEGKFYFTGTTPGIRDLRAVTLSDQELIQRLVPLAVLFVLILILRRPVLSIFLVLSVIWGYYVTLGITELVFSWLRGATYHGLDWKLPTFLFVILVAVGEDYNIYLVTRVMEEQKKFGFAEGLKSALRKTGGIITSCGIIMAGTFIAMISGSLRTMHQLGFALALGVLLDTFIIRTILVPCVIVLLERVMPRRLARSKPVESERLPQIPVPHTASQPSVETHV